MRAMRNVLWLVGVGVAISAALAACIVVAPVVRPVGYSGDSTLITTPMRVHLLDGSAVLFERGVTVRGDSLHGFGRRYALDRERHWAAKPVPLDSVAGMETFGDQVRPVESTLLTLGGIALGAAAAAAVTVAILGSCPTIYADSAGQLVLEAEAFSYSIAPMFEARDVDRLRLAADTDGMVRLEVRNEAAETHFINHLELISVSHSPAEVVVPDQRARPVALAELSPVVTARDRAGRDVRGSLAATDDDAFATDDGVLARAHTANITDHIDLDVPVPAGADSLALYLHMRGSLLTTVLLYDVMLGAQGARAVDWIGQELTSIEGAVDLARWYADRMGLRVLIEDGDALRQVAYVPSSGPIAWRSMAVVLPVTSAGRMHVRLEFPADEWRIDQVAVASTMRRPAERPVTLSEVRGADERPNAEALRQLRDSDDRYLEVLPGRRFSIRFDVGVPPSDSSRTYLLASQGYYLEWIRPQWVRKAGMTPPSFTPSDSALVAAMRLWQPAKDSLDRRFHESRVPVR